MRLFEIIESVRSSDDLRLGVINGFKFIFPGGATKLPANLSVSNLQAVCRNFADRLELIVRRNIEIQTFHIYLKRYNVVLFCTHNIQTGTVFINNIYDTERLKTDTNLSVMVMDDLYEVFDNLNPIKYQGYKIRDDMNLHGIDRIKDHELQYHVTREQVEQMMKETVDKIKYLNTLGFYVRFAQVYSASAHQGLICKLRPQDNLIVIKTYLPHNSNRTKANVVLFNVK